MYLHSDELEKFKIGKCIRKKFKGMAYDGKIVSLNLDEKFYNSRYTDKDEEDMTVPDVQRFWIAKEVSKKKRSSKKTTNNVEIKMNGYSTCHTDGWGWKTKI